MKFLQSFKLFEFNRKDVQVITSTEINNKFTIAFEFELESDDENVGIPSEEDVIIRFKKELYSYFKSINMDVSKYEKFINDTINVIDFNDEEYTYEEILVSKTKDPIKNEIINVIAQLLEPYFEPEDEDEDKMGNYLDENEAMLYSKGKVKEYLPNFYNKYKDDINFVFDTTIINGIEITNKPYTNSINEALDMLKVFFNDFENQSFWKMSKNTSIHINIGYKEKGVEWNILKGMILLKDWKTGDELPYIFKDIPSRVDSSYAQSFMNKIKYKDLKNINFNDIKKLESDFYKVFKKLYKQFSDKTFGFNLSKMEHYGYVEFRYVGGPDLTYEKLEYKVLHLCYIVYCMTNFEYKRKEYIKGLYKYIDYLKSKS